MKQGNFLTEFFFFFPRVSMYVLCLPFALCFVFKLVRQGFIFLFPFPLRLLIDESIEDMELKCC
jgi:hypothetical protein